MGQPTGSAPLARCLLVLLAVTAGTVLGVAPLLPDALALGRAIRSGVVAGEPFDAVLVQICEIAVMGCAAWLWLASTVTAVDAARGRKPRHRGVPGAVRRVVLAACGVALVGGLGAPAHADDGAGTSPLEGLPMPDRATTATHVSRVFARAASHQDRAGHPPLRPTAVVVVQPGDTLWAIARAGLPPDTDDTTVAARVREIHRANRAVIGADPDLIHPHQRLRMPATSREETR
jgi:hypothetical protein